MSALRVQDGGMAFPAPSDHPFETGMSLRDYFAAHAMVALVSRDSFAQGESSIQIDAARCYRMADAMLKAGNK